MTIESTVGGEAGPGAGAVRALPLVDISRFRSGDPAVREAFLADLRHAAHDVGFFYVTGHGIAPDVTDGVLAAAHEFFGLPLEERLRIENVNSPHFRGYSRVGTERTAGAADQRDQSTSGRSGRPSTRCRRTSRTSRWSAPTSGPPPRRRSSRRCGAGWTRRTGSRARC